MAKGWRQIGTAMAAVASLSLACAGGTENNGLGTAATFGSVSNATGTADEGASWSPDGDQDGDGATGVGDVDAMTGSMEETDGAEGPTNPNELCNGLDDDDNGQIDDGLGTLSCGEGVCANTVAACQGGVPAVCTPLPGGVEVCNGLDDDCNSMTDEGLTTSCASACGDGTETCVDGVLECDAPQPIAESCNYEDDNCNGSLDEGVAGCRIGVHRSYSASASAHLYTTSLPEAMSGGFSLEAQDYYFVYAAAHPGLVGFYRCLKTNGKRFYTQSSVCEGQTVESTLGYTSSTDTGETTPLYRLYNGSQGNHFYTTSAAERDAALAGGYIDEGVATYVF